MNNDWNYESVFTALAKATSEVEIREIRERAEARRISSKLMNDSQTVILAADICERADARLDALLARGVKAHGKRGGRSKFVPLHSLTKSPSGHERG